MIKSIFLLIALCLFQNGAAYARVCELGGTIGKQNRIIYINGIWNTSVDACKSAEALKATLSTNSIDFSTYGIEFFYNPHDGKIADVTELRFQAFISDVAKKRATATGVTYISQLGSLYNDLLSGAATCASYAETMHFSYTFAAPPFLKGEAQIERDRAACQRVVDVTASLISKLSDYASTSKVVTVAHSQGNFFVEASRAVLGFRNSTIQGNIQSVGVAAIAAAPADSRYATISQDMALFTAQKINTDLIGLNDYSPAVAPIRACALAHLCLDLPGMGFAPENIAAATGTLDIQAYLAEASGDLLAQYLVSLILDGNRYFFHEFVNVYLSSNIGDSARKPLARHVVDLVKEALAVQNPPIQISATGSGTVTSTDGQVNCTIVSGIATGSCSIPRGASVTNLVAIPAVAGSFVSWGGICSGTGATCSISPGVVDSIVIVYFSSERYSRIPKGDGTFYDLEECVHDNTSGLTWEGKTSSGPRVGSRVLTNWGDGRVNDTSSYTQYLNSIKHCGYSDWRTPSITEYRTIHVRMWTGGSYFETATDPAWFVNTPGGEHWTSTTSPYHSPETVALMCDLIWAYRLPSHPCGGFYPRGRSSEKYFKAVR